MADIRRELDAIYNSRRDKAYRALEAIKSEIYKSIPELYILDDRINMTGIQYAQSLIRGDGPAMDSQELSSVLSSLNKEKAELIKNGGFSPECLEPDFACKKCKDTGYIEDAATFAVTYCSCYQQLYIERLYKASNILNDDKTGLSNFNESFYPDKSDKKRYGIDASPREQITRIKEHCESFIMSFQNNDTHNLYFFGPAGTGKTFFARSVGLEIIKLGYTVLYLSASSMFDMIRKMRFSADADESDMAYQSLITTQLLILDDLGTEPASDARHAEFLNLLEARRNRSQYHTAKTIISSNLDMKRLYQEYNERIASRIAGEFDALQFIGEDIRILKKYLKS